MATLGASSLSSEPKAASVSGTAVTVKRERSANIEVKTLEEKFTALEEKFAALEKRYNDLHEKALTITENSTGKVTTIPVARVRKAVSNRMLTALEL